MAKIVEQVEVRADTSQAQSETKKLGSTMAGAFVKAQVAMAALSKAYDLLEGQVKAGISDALEYEKTNIALNASLQATGNDVGFVSAKLQEQANQLEAITNISDEVIRKYQQQSISLGVTADKTDDLIRASISLANATGKSVDTAFRELTQSMSGVATRTLKLIPGINDLTKEQLEHGDAIELVNEQYGDLIDIGSRGMPGAIATLNTSWANLREQMSLTVTQSKTLQQMMRGLANTLQVIAAGKYWETLFESGPTGIANKARELREEIKKISDDAKADLESRAGGTGGGTGGGGGRRPPPPPMVLEGLDLDLRIGPTEKDASLAARNWEVYQGVEATRLEGLRELHSNHKIMMEDIKIREAERLVEISEKANKKQFDWDKYYSKKKEDLIGMTTTAMASSMMTGLQAMVDGSEDAGKQMLASFLGTLGQQMMARGVADILLAGSMLITSWGAAAAPAGKLAAIGAAEVALGGGLSVAAAKLGGKGGDIPRGGGAGGGGGGGAGDFQGGGGGAPAQQSQEPQPITIVFNGPTTAAEVGVAIKRAIGEADRVGL